jgi:predicted Na+-dependent transporter
VIRVQALLERRMLPLVVALALVGVVTPGPARALDRHSAIDVVLAVLVLASALGVPAGAGRAVTTLAPRLAVVLVAATVGLPLLADALGHLVGAAALRHGILAVGVAPAEVASVGLSGLAGGDVAVAAALLVASTVVSVIVAGPILSLLVGAGVSSGAVLGQLALVVGLPLLAGLGVRTRAALGPTRLAAAGSVAVVAVLTLVVLVAAQVRLAPAYLAVTGVLAALLAVSAAGGWALGRLLPDAAGRSALLHVSMRDFAVASGIAAAAFGPAATGPLGIYGVLVIAWGAGAAAVAAAKRPGRS